MSKTVSFCTAPGNFNREIGYGNASWNIINNLKELGFYVPFDDPAAPVQINFSQPQWMHIRDSQHSIGYVPWESTYLPEGWTEVLETVDELWTTSNWCKGVFENNGLKDVKVYHHGIEDLWKHPMKRNRGEVLRFLHIGDPASRKGGQQCLDAFVAAFGNRTDVRLTIKAFGHSEVRYKDRTGNILGPVTDLNNVKLNCHVLKQEELLSVYLNHDVLIYNSMGEGFGLIPLQGLATGMPAIVTESWCDYRDYIVPLDSVLGATNWPTMHPGAIYFPKFDNLVDILRNIDKEYETYADQSFNQINNLYEQFDWLKLTKIAFENFI